MKRVSFEELRRLTGKGYQTIKRRLENAGLKSIGYGDGPGKAILWDSRQALKAIYAPDADGGLDPQQEKAKLDEARRIAQELKNDEAEGRLIDAEVNKKFWTDQILSWKTRIQGLPTKLASLIPEKHRDRCFDLLTSEVNEVLTELSNVAKSDTGK